MGSPIRYNDEWLSAHVGDYSSFVALTEDYNKIFGSSVKPSTMALHCNKKLGVRKDRAIQWDDEWLNCHCLSASTYDVLTEMYNAEHGTNVTRSAVKNRCKHGLGISKPSNGKTPWTATEDAWLIANYPGIGIKASVEGLKSALGSDRTYYMVKNRVNILGIRCDEDVLTNLKIQCHILPDGSFYTDPTQNRVYYKASGEWVSYGKYVWEQAHGEVPKGYIIKYLDGNTLNNELSNLMAIPIKYLGQLVGNKLASSNPILTKAGIMWCELNERITI